jgi:hypothetical protein
VRQKKEICKPMTDQIAEQEEISKAGGKKRESK